MSRKIRVPPLPPIPARPKPKTVAPVKAEPKIEGPPTLAGYFNGDDRYLAHFKKLSELQREDEIKAGRIHVVWAPSESRELRSRLHAQLEGLDNSLRLGHER